VDVYVHRYRRLVKRVNEHAVCSLASDARKLQEAVDVRGHLASEPAQDCFRDLLNAGGLDVVKADAVDYLFYLVDVGQSKVVGRLELGEQFVYHARGVLIP